MKSLRARASGDASAMLRCIPLCGKATQEARFDE